MTDRKKQLREAFRRWAAKPENRKKRRAQQRAAYRQNPDAKRAKERERYRKKREAAGLPYKPRKETRK